nr:hypothetical protein [Candidatus Sigynarchaeota archaeon]
MAISGSGRGYMIWAETPTIGSENLTLRFRSARNLLTEVGARHNWSSIAPSLLNVNQTFTKGFVVGAPSKNGSLFVLFSNLTGRAAGLENIDIMLWINGTTVALVQSITANWTSMGSCHSFWLRAPCGKMLFSEDDTRHVAWNNGTHLFYKCNSSATVIVDSGAIMADFAMITNSTGGIHIVYSKAVSIADAVSKKIFWTSKQNSGSFSTPVALTSSNFEDTGPDAMFDENDNLHLTWSGFNNGNGSNIYAIYYKIRFANGTLSAEHNISDANSLTLSGSSPANPSAYQSQVFLLNGELHFLYSDTRQFSSGGTNILNGSNMMWQSYPNSTSLGSHSIRILTEAGPFETIFFDAVATKEDDLFCAYLSRDAIDYRVRLVKIDDTVPMPTITHPPALNYPGDYAINKPPTFTVNFTIVESDLNSLTVTWDSTPLSVSLQQRSVSIDADLLGLGRHSFIIYVRDEVGNTVTFTRSITLFGDFDGPLPLGPIILSIGIPTLLVLVWLYKNWPKIQNRRLQLKLKSKKKAGEGAWSENEEPLEDV